MIIIYISRRIALESIIGDTSGSAQQAIYCFLKSENFEDATGKSLSIGGDTDIIACIVGLLAESYYGLD